MAMVMIEGSQADALILRYWKNYEIAGIAKEMRISWAEADQLIKQAEEEIKKILLKHDDFKGGLR